MIHFLDVLNEQATWSELEDVRKWGSEVLSQNLVDCDDELMLLNNDFKFIRQQLSMLHFGETLDIDELDQRLSTIQLCFAFNSESKPESISGLPPLRAAVKDSSPGASVRCLRNTLLVQFAHFLSDALANGAAVARCEGLYRKELSKNYKTRAQLLSAESGREGGSQVSVNQESLEQRWREELALLTESNANQVSDLIRCEDFFVPAKAAKFCSDACRFNTFQIKKQISNPDYLADKQRRYRNRKSKT